MWGTSLGGLTSINNRVRSTQTQQCKKKKLGRSFEANTTGGMDEIRDNRGMMCLWPSAVMVFVLGLPHLE